jgi:GDP-4-dehydro-6-deoxy-D-mannose reductase
MSRPSCGRKTRTLSARPPLTWSGYQYHVAGGVDVVRVRPFTHIGPGQTSRFVAASFAQQIAEIEQGRRPPVIEVGNLEAMRDFTDVRDMVRAYELALLNASPGLSITSVGAQPYRSGRSSICC